MAKHRVQLFNQSRGVEVDTDATPGATVGVNLTLEDGTVVTYDMLFRQPPSDSGDPGAVYWRTIMEIPPNVTALQHQDGTGLYVLTGPGESATRAITSATLQVQHGDGVAGDPTVDLPELPDTGGGTLQKTARDQYGRLAGTSEATTDDLPEGSNLYFTDERADARVDAGIAEHVAQPDPHPQYTTASEAAAAAPVQSVNGKQGAVTLAAADVGAAASDDSRLTNSREWTASTVTQAEAEAGTATTRRAWTAQRVRQAIAAWWNGSAAKTMLDGLVVQTITDGDTTHAPSGDAVFDALAGKFDKTGGTVTGSVTVEGGFTGGTAAGGTTFTFNRPGNAPEGSLIEYNSPGGQPGIIMRNGPGVRGDIRLHAESIRLGLSTTGSVPNGFLIVWGDTYGISSNGDGSWTLGRPVYRWGEVFSVNGTINTSDAREKTEPRDLTEAELAAAADIARLPCIFQWLHAIEEKGEDARLHASPTVQAVIAAMEAHGLDPFRYGFVCFDQWDEQPEIRDGETGEVTQEYRPAGDRYSLRPTELAHFVLRGLAHRQDELERRLAALEG